LDKKQQISISDINDKDIERLEYEKYKNQVKDKCTAPICDYP